MPLLRSERGRIGPVSAALACGALMLGAPAGAQVEDLGVAEILGLSQVSLQHLDVPAEGQFAEIALTLGETPVSIIMFRHSNRADGFTVWSYNEANELVPTEAPPVRTYRGMLKGVSGSRVAASLIDGQLTGWIQVGGELWAVQPADDANQNAAHDLHAVYHAEDVLPTPFECGVDADVLQHVQHQFEGIAPAGGGTTICEIAWDADFEYFQLNGSSIPNTVNDIENVLNAVQNIYLAEVGIGYELTDVIVRNTVNDPYTTTDSGALLSQFQQEWINNQGSIHRDVAHMMTGKNLNGSIIGISFGGGICSGFFGYSLSQSKFTNNFILRTALTAHEIGHDWTADHCDGAPDCAIMCSAIGACPGGVTTFDAASEVKINQVKNNAPCLDEDISGGEGTWSATVTTNDGNETVEFGETATVKLSLNFEPNVDGVNVFGLAATIFDVLNVVNGDNGHIESWDVLNDLDQLTGDLTETDGTNLFGVNAGQLTAFGPFTPDDPIDVLEFDWTSDENSNFAVVYETVTEVLLVWEPGDDNEEAVEWVPVDTLIAFQAVEGSACFADCNEDGNLNILDFVCYQNLFTSGSDDADCNGDGNLNILDFVCFQSEFQAGCP